MIRRVLVAYNADWLVTDVRANSDVVAMAVGVRSALERRGFSAELLAVSGEDVCEVVQRVRSHRPDLVFNLCESLLRDARHEPVLPALLDLYGIPYTGSAPLALGIALRKSRTKELMRARGVPTPEAVAIVPGESADAALALGFPVIVKPGREDASIGIEAGSVVRTPEALADRVRRIHDEFRQEALVERFIDGRELYVTVLGNGAASRALPIHEIDFAHLPAALPRIVTYNGKWSEQHEEYVGTKPVLALLTPEQQRRCEAAARAALTAVGVRDYGRCDIRLTADDTPYVIDVNPNCDISEDAGVARAARAAGLDYPALIASIAEAALARSATDPEAQ